MVDTGQERHPPIEDDQSAAWAENKAHIMIWLAYARCENQEEIDRIEDGLLKQVKDPRLAARRS